MKRGHIINVNNVVGWPNKKRDRDKGRKVVTKLGFLEKLTYKEII